MASTMQDGYLCRVKLQPRAKSLGGVAAAAQMPLGIVPRQRAFGQIAGVLLQQQIALFERAGKAAYDLQPVATCSRIPFRERAGGQLSPPGLRCILQGREEQLQEGSKLGNFLAEIQVLGVCTQSARLGRRDGLPARMNLVNQASWMARTI
jgi:hypothetical protein